MSEQKETKGVGRRQVASPEDGKGGGAESLKNEAGKVALSPPEGETLERTFLADDLIPDSAAAFGYQVPSVEEAIKAAQATERLNVDQETLSKPLEEQALYEPCKPGAAHFTLRVAVWRGKAVAIDLTTTPKNPKLAECLKGRIRELTWPAKVPPPST